MIKLKWVNKKELTIDNLLNYRCIYYNNPILFNEFYNGILKLL